MAHFLALELLLRLEAGVVARETYNQWETVDLVEAQVLPQLLALV
jgi:hypothetical protein